MLNFILVIAPVFAAVVGVAAYLLLRRRRRLKSRNKVKPLSERLAFTKQSFAGRLSALFTRERVDDAFIAELEETLLSADVGVPTCERLLAAVRGADSPSQARELLRDRMVSLFAGMGEPPVDRKPHVILVLGVNGVGKTTSIAKLAYRYQSRGKRVLLAAGDTFRAAAIEQLEVWGQRLNCEVVAQKKGGDAASVAFDAVSKARAKGHDVVLVDTAGRIHTKHNLMEELEKIDRVIAKAYPGAPHERWLILDATVGQNGLSQARRFHESLGLTGVIVTKLDGTAKGGIVCAVTELGIPVVSIGVGEGMADLRPFEPRAFVDAILGSN